MPLGSRIFEWMISGEKDWMKLCDTNEVVNLLESEKKFLEMEISKNDNVFFFFFSFVGATLTNIRSKLQFFKFIFIYHKW